MNQFRHLLVVIDEQNFTLRAIKRAVYIAKKTKGRLTLVMLNHNFLLHQMANVIAHRNEPKNLVTHEQKIERLVNYAASQNLVGEGHIVDVKTVDKPSEILTIVQEKDVDAVFVAASRHDWWAKFDILPVEVYLMRESDASVFVVKNVDWHESGHILSAVQAFSEDSLHRQLSESIIEESGHLAKLFHKECHFIDCFFDGSYSMSMHQYIDQQELDQQHKQAIGQLCDKYHLAEQHIHLNHYLPEFAVNSISHSVDSDLIIVGHSGEHGFKNRVFGHTAEEMLEVIDCDLLVMKPMLTGSEVLHH